VQIVWRADLDNIADAEAILEATAPISTEALPMPFFAAKRWLERKASTVTDLEGVGTSDGPQEEPAPRVFLIWRGHGKSSADIRMLRPGDTIVVRSTEGGCDEFGWNPSSVAPVRDIGDQCANARVRNGGGRYRIRLHGDVHPEWRDEIGRIAKLVEAGEPVPAELCESLLGAAGAEGSGRVHGYGRKGLLVESGWKKRPEDKQRPEPAEADEPEDGDAASFTTEVTLRAHTAGVVGKARLYTKKCGLNGAATAVIEAAQRHDIGKQDERFQFMLSPTKTPELLAKSKLKDRRRQRESEYPEGARHEFASVLLAEQYGEWPAGCDAELALYLIGSHHGHGRPFPPVWSDEGYTIRAEIEGRELAVENVHRVGHLDSNWADRYAAMSRKYGWWGLAYLETMVRRADCVRSREEEQEMAE
jgi:CRISPR-associated endonuclease/helicase Cas3